MIKKVLFDKDAFWKLRSEKRSKEIQEEQNEIIRQLCKFNSFKRFMKKMFFITVNLDTGNMVVKENENNDGNIYCSECYENLKGDIKRHEEENDEVDDW